MNKKLLLVALAILASAFTTTAFAAPCDTSATLQFVGVGSSAQFNTLAYAASDVIAAEASTFHLFSAKGAETSGDQTAAIQDVRVSGVPQDSATLWVMWDANSACNVFAYYSVDSTIGVRAYFAAQQLAGDTGGSKLYNSAAVLPCLAGQGTEYPSGACQNKGVDLTTAGFCTGSCKQGQVGGLADTDLTLPHFVYVALTTPVVPQQTTTTVPASYCGQNYPAASTSAYYCYFNAAGTDIRPEDAFYATNRALGVPATGVAGLNYGNANCTIAGGTNCQIYDSFSQGGVFNVLKFNVTAKDPYKTTATVPTYTTLSVGASPVLVLVNNADTAGLGKTYTDTNGRTSYLFNDILRSKLSFIFEGNTKCTGDILPAAPLSSANHQPGAGFGSGPALQVIQREPLSGTYNTFEFTAVRTMGASSNTATSKPSTSAWTSNDEGGQEMWAQASSSDETNAAVFPWILDPGATSMGWSSGTLASACGTLSTTGGINKVTNPSGTQNCSDPLFISGSLLSKAPACASGTYLRMRAIGTGQEVSDTMGLNNTGVEQVKDGIGYAFWSYGNVSKATSSVGHYMTVDAIDPLFTTEGGYGWGASTPERNDGLAAWNLPQCNLGSLPCTTNISFTHIYDGKYPLWSLLRVVTMANKSATTTVTPAYVLDLVAYNQIEVANAARNTNDFVPFLTNLTNSGTLTAPAWKGDLNLGVFRVHSKTAGDPINQGNGHEPCGGVFTGINLQGGYVNNTVCLIDSGNDVGGAVMTVQDDVDFIHDFAGTSTEGVTLPATYEEYNLHQ
jgi:hypothetical protein